MMSQLYRQLNRISHHHFRYHSFLEREKRWNYDKFILKLELGCIKLIDYFILWHLLSKLVSHGELPEDYIKAHKLCCESSILIAHKLCLIIFSHAGCLPFFPFFQNLFRFYYIGPTNVRQQV